MNARMVRTTRTIGPATAPVNVPKKALDLARAALDALADLDENTFVEVEINEPHAMRAVVPVGYLRRYLAAQFIPGREVLMFDSDEEVTPEVAASLFGISPRHLNTLLDVEEIPYRHVGNQRRIRMLDLCAAMNCSLPLVSERPDLKTSGRLLSGVSAGPARFQVC